MVNGYGILWICLRCNYIDSCVGVTRSTGTRYRWGTSGWTSSI